MLLRSILQRADDEEVNNLEPSDRNYWQKRTSDDTIKALDLCIEYMKSINNQFNANYNKGYVGIKDNNKSNNMLIFWPKQDFLRVGTKNAEKDRWFNELESVGIYVYRDKKTNRVQFRIKAKDAERNKDLLIRLFRDAYQLDHYNEET